MSRECYSNGVTHTHTPKLKVVRTIFKIRTEQNGREKKGDEEKVLGLASLSEKSDRNSVCAAQNEQNFTSHESHFTMPFIDKQCSRALIKPTS